MDVEAPTGIGRSLAIVAMGGSLFAYLQDFEREYQKPADEVWAINSAGVWLSRLLIDKIIAMDNFRRDLAEHPQYVQNIVNRGVPVITDMADPEWPATEAYPLRRVLDDIWPGANSVADILPPLYNTCNYALALGIADKFERISLYGCNFSLPDDRWELHDEAVKHSDKPFWWPYHMKQIVMRRRDREPGGPTMHFLIGVAHERKIKLEFTDSLVEADRIPHFYGYEYQPNPYEERKNADS